MVYHAPMFFRHDGMGPWARENAAGAMAMDAVQIRAVVFDYGNTLIPFGREQLDTYYAILASGLEARYGPLDRPKFQAFRAASRMAPYVGEPPTYKENDFAVLTAALIKEVYGVTAGEDDIEELLRLRLEAFIELVTVETRVHEVLRRLGEHYALGLLSNYPDGKAIRVSLERCGLTPYFQSIVVSGEVGFVKPHPLIFAVVLAELGVRADEVLFVGDNWLADVQGAKRNGLHAAHMKRWTPPEHFKVEPGDFAPDAEIRHLDELPALLALEGA